ncbi:putative U3 small nucleolar RNA-associated protein 7 [Leucoagaricus sp. SymC.cos]|nr:putative U3 small nucleolar RNA-associated protein 7 [Leucoagaricus sp. SymC.cos]
MSNPHDLTHRSLTSFYFIPLQDVLTMPRPRWWYIQYPCTRISGELNFDSSEADPFERRKVRREREAEELLDEIQPDPIALNRELLPRLQSFPYLSRRWQTCSRDALRSTSCFDQLHLSGKADMTEEPDTDFQLAVRRVELKKDNKDTGGGESETSLEEQ